MKNESMLSQTVSLFLQQKQMQSNGDINSEVNIFAEPEYSQSIYCDQDISDNDMEFNISVTSSVKSLRARNLDINYIKINGGH